MAEENYSTYQWAPDIKGVVNFSELSIEKSSTGEDVLGIDLNVTVKVTITHDNIFALIGGTYQVKVTGTKKDGDGSNDITLYCTCNTPENKPILCIEESDERYKIDLTLSGVYGRGLLSDNPEEYSFNCQPDTFKIQVGEDDYSNEYLYILRKPELITNLLIDSRSADNTYVKGSALPINEIQNISTIDFNDIKINDVQRDIFYKLNNIGGENIVTNKLSAPELTVVDLPEKEDEQIIICKSRSKNKGVTFKTKDPDIGRKHFGYIIDIKDYRSAGYNSVWVNRETLDKIFPGMPTDIMSNTDMFECTDSFNFHELTYKVHDVAVSNWVNNQGQEFTPEDQIKLNTYAPIYKAVTINQSTGDSIRHNNMLLKNIEFVKFGEKVIKLNYKPLYED